MISEARQWRLGYREAVREDGDRTWVLLFGEAFNEELARKHVLRRRAQMRLA
jgi:hypothetical protein